MKSHAFALLSHGLRQPSRFDLVRSQRKFLTTSVCRSSVATPAAIRTKTSTTSAPPLKKKICIVGAGPAGFYAAQYIVKHLTDVQVDIVEKLPVPFGLVRYFQL